MTTDEWALPEYNTEKVGRVSKAEQEMLLWWVREVLAYKILELLRRPKVSIVWDVNVLQELPVGPLMRDIADRQEASHVLLEISSDAGIRLAFVNEDRIRELQEG